MRKMTCPDGGGAAAESSLVARERLIEAGIQELQEYGVQGFSLRRVAQSCDLSCAAPYRHFRDKQELLQAVAETLNRRWFARQSEALAQLGGNTGMQLRTICREYLRFLCDNPHFCALVTQRDEDTGKWRLNRLFDQSSLTKQLIVRYAKEHHMTYEDVYCRVYAIRALLYGAAMMNQHDDMRLNEATIDALCRVIDSQICGNAPVILDSTGAL